MNWDYRLMAHENIHGDVHFEIHEVCFDDHEKPIICTDTPTASESLEIKGVDIVLVQMKQCLTKPIIWYGKKFPQMYEDAVKYLEEDK